jgi:hypothetical protein
MLAHLRKSRRNVAYTAVWNALDYVAMVSTVDPAVDAKKSLHAFLSDADKWTCELCASMALVSPGVAQFLADNTFHQMILMLSKVHRSDCSSLEGLWEKRRS